MSQLARRAILGYAAPQPKPVAEPRTWWERAQQGKLVAKDMTKGNK